MSVYALNPPPWLFFSFYSFHFFFFAQSTGAVEYTNCVSAEGYDPPPNECPWWPIRLGLLNTSTAFRQRGKTSLMSVLIWQQTIWWWGSNNSWVLGNALYLFNAIARRSTLARSGSTWEGPIYLSNKTKLCPYPKLNCLK